MASPVLPRLISPIVDTELGAFPVVAVTGARQTGKSTLMRSLPSLRDHLYLSLDDFDVRFQAREEPETLLERAPRLVLDEVQREPELILAVKRAVDEPQRRPRGRFVLTGSANLLMAKRISETLAGRAAYVTLWPFTRREKLGLGTAGIWNALLETPAAEWRDRVLEEESAPGDWRTVAVRGGYPTPALEKRGTDEIGLWFDAYVTTYLERDLQDLAAIDNLVDFRRLMRAAALRLGSLVNQAEIARDLGLSHATAHRYLNLLETSYQLVRVEAYSVNRTKRLVKSPKLYWSDVGLARHLAGIEPTGAHLENLVLGDLLAWRSTRSDRPQVLFWRTVSGDEVDFVVEVGDRLLPIEVKSRKRPRSSDVAGLRAFQSEYGDAVRGCLLLHDGDEVSWLADGILGAPWWRVL